ncbi:hypothetical protein EV356DRAFT_458507, partial [Viridothelium virens]
LYEDSWRKLQQISPQLKSYKNRQLYLTWQLSLDHIKQQNKHSAMLLKLWVYFNNQNLWFKILQAERRGGPEWFCKITKDELSFNKVVRVVYHHGLVEINHSSKKNGVKPRGY